MKKAHSYWENTNCQIICHSKFMSTASLIHVSNDLIYVVNKEFFNFIWKGKDKIKRFALIHDIAVWRVKDAWLRICYSSTKNYVFEEVHWRLCWSLENFLELLFGKSRRKVNFAVPFSGLSKFTIAMPGFYKYCLDMWSTLKGKEVCSYEDIMNQLVWNNKYILSDGKLLYHAFFHNTCGISKVRDLVSTDNIFLGSEKIPQYKTPSEYLLLMGVVSAILNDCCSTVKGNVFTLNRILSLKIRFKCQ